ncbi:hypothetical protein M433DRAFT_8482 [Acidomyces richmondensis BFW]|nr:hypothetical protein M433DRAFT_8482 [Acidomyces richmondensis BFW]
MDQGRNQNWTQVFFDKQRSKWCLAQLQRLRTLVDSLSRPGDQRPQTVLFCGDQKRNEALSSLFPTIWEARIGGDAGGISIHADAQTVEANAPLFLAVSNPMKISSGFSEDVDFESVIWHQGGENEWMGLNDAIHSRLLFLFTDVVCVFADDLGGIKPAVDLVERWWAACDGRPSQHPEGVWPTVIIFATDHNEDRFSQPHEVVDKRAGPSSRQQTLALIKTAEQCSSKTLQSFLEEAWDRRARRGNLFPASQLPDLFQAATKHLAGTRDIPFSFTISSYNPTKAYLHSLIAWLKLSVPHLGEHVALDMVGSAILFEAYPPEGHVYHPMDVWEGRYQRYVVEACDRVFPTPDQDVRKSDPSRISERPAVKLLTLFAEEFGKGGDWSLRARIAHLREVSGPLTRLDFRQNFVCLLCLASPPENVLKCAHSLCDQCVVRTGQPLPYHEYLFRVQCPLCTDMSTTKISLRPPTAGIRAWSMDGGGIRGYSQLCIFRRLENDCGCPLVNFVDFGIGTSAGGINILAMLACRWDLNDCLNLFTRFANQMFRKPKSAIGRAYARFNQIIKGCLYTRAQVNNVINQAFGKHSSRSMFDCSSAKIAVTSCYDFTKPALLTSYNGVKPQNKDPRLNQSERLDCDEEVLRITSYKIGDAANRTSSIPLIMQGFEDRLADGGLWAQNPSGLVIPEIERITGEDSSMLDLLISVGTGRASSDVTDQEFPLQSILERFGILGSVATFLLRKTFEHLDPESVHKQLLDCLSPSIYYRLNVELTPPLPRLDDVSAMTAIHAKVDHTDFSQPFRDIRLALLSSSFFFELEEMPKFKNGSYFCKGTIRRRVSAKNVKALLKSLHCENINFLLSRPQSEQSGSYLNDASGCHDVVGKYDATEKYCYMCRKFHLPVSFSVNTLGERVWLSAQLSNGMRRRISNFPRPMNWFVARQNLRNSKKLSCSGLDPGFKTKYKLRRCKV